MENHQIRKVLSFSALLILPIVGACWFRQPEKRCCSEISNGVCFEREVGATFPICPKNFAHKFTLFTRTNNETGTLFTKNSIPSEFSNNRQTIFIVHGWRETAGGLYTTMKDKLLEAEDYNVVTVDWSGGASDYYYVQSAANVVSMGGLVGAVINSMRQVSGSNPNYWCIGHSLGAHLCGYASRTALPPLDRITGLDPAAPLFYGIGIRSITAKYVDVIHTDPLLGAIEPRGTVDFYPNGGRNQPGCPQVSRSGRSTTDQEKIKIMQQSRTGRDSTVCSHTRSVEYMITSIENPDCFKADHECSYYGDIPGSCQNITDPANYGVMGYNATAYKSAGLLYMVLNTTAPYCT